MFYYYSQCYFPLKASQEKEVKLNKGETLLLKAGHASSDCEDKGEYTIYFEQFESTHLPCQGFGKKCDYEITVRILLSGGSVTDAVKSNNKYTVHIYFGNEFSGDRFFMPHRSIKLYEEGRYINIPVAIMSKKSKGKENYFIAKNVTFSDKALYENK